MQCIEPVAGSSSMPTDGSKQSAHVIHVTLAGSGNNRSADPDVQFGKSGKIGRERSHLLSLIHHHEVIARFHYQRRFQT